ncbi:MAG TPA: right-handed parallel beta-helix repeat-containing protein [Acidimicrobiales bacterium]|nr:right-handed parallel beta-helix repeat-containing protein [Acidimicrobiales bacterium]
MASAGAAPGTLTVGCGPTSYPTIGAAVAAAGPGNTILVCPGTYHEDVVVPPTKPLSIRGSGNPVIDATGFDNGVQVLASHSTVSGLVVKNATGEGILVQGTPGTPITNVTVASNTVAQNDQGNPTSAPLTTSPYAECNGSPQAPGDCGEGIHLMVADNSTVVGNNVSNNSGGVLLTDEFGPTDGNLVLFNTISNNTYDCGVTLAGHNPGAFSGGVPQPSVGGVFDNRIFANSISGNGVAGQGAGVVLATPFPGGAVYDNQVQGNVLSGNGLAGVTLHSHAPGQDLNGNTVEGNLIGTNNLDGDPDFFPSVDPSTTGVIVATVAPLSITVDHNIIANNVYGIWTMPEATITGTSTNLYLGVTTPVFVAS